MKSEQETREYLREAEQNAITSLSANKWERFGYWAAQSVHLRKILGMSHTRSPFREFAELARVKLNAEEAKTGAGGLGGFCLSGSGMDKEG